MSSFTLYSHYLLVYFIWKVPFFYFILLSSFSYQQYNCHILLHNMMWCWLLSAISFSFFFFFSSSFLFSPFFISVEIMIFMYIIIICRNKINKKTKKNSNKKNFEAWLFYNKCVKCSNALNERQYYSITNGLVQLSNPLILRIT